MTDFESGSNANEEYELKEQREGDLKKLLFSESQVGKEIIDSVPSFFFADSGVVIQVEQSKFDVDYKLPDRTASIRDGQYIGKIDFVPLGHTDFAEKDMLFAVAGAAHGVGEFIHCVYDDDVPAEKRIPYTRYLVGDTNLRMAYSAENVGFDIKGRENYQEKMDRLKAKKNAREITEEEYARELNNLLETGGVRVVGEISKIKQTLEYVDKKTGKSKRDKYNQILERARREFLRTHPTIQPKTLVNEAPLL